MRKSPQYFTQSRVALSFHRKLQPGIFGVKQFNPDLRVLDAAFRENVIPAFLPRSLRLFFGGVCRVRPVKEVQIIGHRWLRPRDTSCCRYRPYPFHLLVIRPHLYVLFGRASELRARHEDIVIDDSDVPQFITLASVGAKGLLRCPEYRRSECWRRDTNIASSQG